MSHLDVTYQVAGIGASVVVVVGCLYALWRKSLHPLWRDLVRFFGRVDETINGRPADVDAWGHERAPAVPSLGERMTTLEEAVRDRAQLEGRVTAVETTLADVGQRLTAIESGHQVERVVGKVESIAAWNAVEAIANQPGDQHVDPATD